MGHIFIIAEAGVNHNGDLELAKRLVDVAVEAGANAVKFQTFTAEAIISRFAPKAEYQKRTTGEGESQLEMVRRLELDESAHKVLWERCQERCIAFLSSPFDLAGINLLCRLGIETYKIPSGEITNLPYLRAIGALRKRVILSTGMADLGEVEDAIDVLVASGTARGEITLLHCNTEYPTPLEDVNLRAMLTMRDAFQLDVGYSDHTEGIETSVAAAALGATVIEKHLTLDRAMPGPDHEASLEPREFGALVAAIRNVERVLGSGLKKPSPSEFRNCQIARKSIVAARNIRQGEIFDNGNLAIKRPAKGLSPMVWDTVLGRLAKRDFAEDEPIEL